MNLCIALLAYVSACAPRGACYPASARDQYSLVVKLRVLCKSSGSGEVFYGGSGTGVVVGARSVLTARHVVDHCIELDGQPWLIMATDTRNLAYLMRIDRHARQKIDITRLKTTDSALNPTFVWSLMAHGEARRGDFVCSSLAVPHRYRSCNRVTAARGGMYRTSFPAVPGTSGSPVFDSHGRLIGLVIEFTRCSHDTSRSCGAVVEGRIGGLL